MFYKFFKNLYLLHRRWIYTEEKAKVVAAVWRIEFIQFLDTPAIFFATGRFEE